MLQHLNRKHPDCTADRHVRVPLTLATALKINQYDCSMRSRLIKNQLQLAEHKSVWRLPDKLSELLFAPKIKTHRKENVAVNLFKPKIKFTNFNTTGDIFWSQWVESARAGHPFNIANKSSLGKKRKKEKEGKKGRKKEGRTRGRGFLKWHALENVCGFFLTFIWTERWIY